MKSKDEQIKELEDMLQRKLKEIESLNNAVQNRDEQIRTLELELEAMRQSITWKSVMKFQDIMDELLPLGTERRRYYEQLLRRRAISEEQKGLEKSGGGGGKSKDVQFKEWTGEKIAFAEPPENLDVSIVIPVHNNSRYTFNCLNSVLKHTRRGFEVVVVDDASDDNTSRLLEAVENIRVVVNEKNLGFVESCNVGAEESKGKYLLFLNNDTVVTENWLEPLMEAARDDKVGAVGAKLVYPDGRLQEAGGIIWKDASGWNFGRGDDPDKPEYNFIREVDYCSGAALLVKARLFAESGGFDKRFAPGYYEDTDLCFSLRNMGYKVLYQPKSVVIHFEGVTGGTDLTSGMKRYQNVNRKKFSEKWSSALKEQYTHDPANLFLARGHGKGKCVLIIDHSVPLFDRDAGSYRMYNMLKILIELGCNATFIGNNLRRLEPHTSTLQQLGIEVIYAPYTSSIDSYLVKNGKFFDVAILSRGPIAANHISDIKKHCDNAMVVFDTVDLQFIREMRRADVENDARVLRQAERLKKMEFRLAKTSDVTFVVSPVEKEIMLKEDPSLNIEVISTIHEVKQVEKSFSERSGIMFVGGFTHPPNVDAVKWFAGEIFPIIKEKISDIKFYVLGSDPPKDIKSLSSKDITVTGYVKDLTPYLEECRLSVAPLRYGAGVKGKINQSMSYGLPVITTSIGAEGMALVDRENAMIADDPAEFAEKTVKAYNDEKLWNRLSKNSIKNVQEHYSYEVIKERLKNVIDKEAETNA